MSELKTIQKRSKNKPKIFKSYCWKDNLRKFPKKNSEITNSASKSSPKGEEISSISETPRPTRDNQAALRIPAFIRADKRHTHTSLGPSKRVPRPSQPGGHFLRPKGREACGESVQARSKKSKVIVVAVAGKVEDVETPSVLDCDELRINTSETPKIAYYKMKKGNEESLRFKTRDDEGKSLPIE